jgi:hypothetical protein
MPLSVKSCVVSISIVIGLGGMAKSNAESVCKYGTQASYSASEGNAFIGNVPVCIGEVNAATQGDLAGVTKAAEETRKDLQGRIDTLTASLKVVSDANDALNKRIEELSELIAKSRKTVRLDHGRDHNGQMSHVVFTAKIGPNVPSVPHPANLVLNP